MNYNNNNQPNTYHRRRLSNDVFGNIFSNSPKGHSRRLSYDQRVSSDDYPRNSPVMMHNQSQSFVHHPPPTNQQPIMLQQHHQSQSFVHHPPPTNQQPIKLQQNHQSMSSYNLSSSISNKNNIVPPSARQENMSDDYLHNKYTSGRMSSRRSSAPDIRKTIKQEDEVLEASKVSERERISLLEDEVRKLRRKLKDKSSSLQKWQSLIRDDGSMLSLFEACCLGELDVVEFLFEQGVNINSADHNKGMTPLMVAAEHGQVQLLEYILNQPRIKPDDINKSTIHLNNNKTALIYACSGGQIEIAHALIQKGADINHISNDGITPLIAAAQNNHIDVMELLISSKCDINLFSSSKKIGTALMQAIHARHLSAIDFLLRAGADVMSSISPLYPINEVHMLCRVPYDRKTVEIVKKLMLNKKCGRRILKKPCSKRKLSSLMICAKEGNTNICNLLIKHRAKLDTRDTFGWTPLYHACRADQKDVAQLLIQNGSDASDFSNDYCPFNIAISSGAVQTLQVIVAEGADIRCLSVPEEVEQSSALLLASEEQMQAVQDGMEFRHSYIDSILCNSCTDFASLEHVRNSVFAYLGLITQDDNSRNRANSF